VFVSAAVERGVLADVAELTVATKVVKTNRAIIVTGRFTMSKNREPVAAVKERAWYWDNFFKCQRCPVLRSQLITSLMAGKLLEVERLPKAALLDAVLIAMTTREYHQAEVIDDYTALCRLTNEEWKDPMWSCKVFDQNHLGTADFVVRGSNEFVCHEDQYIPGLIGWFLGHDVPEYFVKELV